MEVSKQSSRKADRLWGCCILSVMMLNGKESQVAHAPRECLEEGCDQGWLVQWPHDLSGSQVTSSHPCGHAQHVLLRLTPFMVPKMMAIVPVLICKHYLGAEAEDSKFLSEIRKPFPKSLSLLTTRVSFAKMSSKPMPKAVTVNGLVPRELA